MIGRAAGVWLVILLMAILNGAIREAWLIPRLGPTIGRAVSTFVLCGVVYLVTWLTVMWINTTSARHALAVGVLWLGLTLAFEFLAGHYLFHKTWAVLLEDYDVTRGRIWPAVLVMVLLAPLWTARARGLITATAS